MTSAGTPSTGSAVGSATGPAADTAAGPVVGPAGGAAAGSVAGPAAVPGAGSAAGPAAAPGAGPAPWEPAVVDRRFTADAEAHRRDAPRFCPSCAGALGLATEFWEGDDRRFYCWCAACDWTGEITTTGGTAVGHEPEH